MQTVNTLEDAIDAMTDEYWELLGLVLLYDVYHIQSPRLWELMAKLNADENWGIKD